MKILNFSLLVCTCCLVIFILAEHGLAYSLLIPVLTLLALAGLIPFVGASTKVLLSPSRMYVLSVVSFILARPLIAIFLPVDLIEVGNGITIENISKTLSIIALSIWVSVAAFSLVSFNGLNLYKSSPRLRFLLPSGAVALAFSLFCVLGSYFLYESWIQSRSLLNLDYFTATEDPIFHAHIKYFFAAKIFGIAWLATKPEKNNFKICALFLLIFSSGFLLLGLRGYFISYLFLYLYFLNETRVFKLVTIIIGALLLLYGSSYVLEYRLGFSVYDNVFEMILRPLYQQGATFEVIFGSIAFSDEILDCISVVEYSMKTKPFGDCVDLARGVPFENGGFASSFFAEAYYLGLIPLVLLSITVGVMLKFMNALVKLRVQPKLGQSAFGAGLVLFFVIPNLIYFGRASSFDFVTKVLQSIIIFYILYQVRIKQDSSEKAA